MKPRNLIIFLFLGFFLCCFSLGCRPTSEYVRTEGMIWNTVYHISYKGRPELRDSILPVLNEVGKSLSVFDRNSLVSQLNSQNKVKADSHLSKVYDASKKINSISNGMFDPTLSPLIDAWGFGLGHTPNKDTLAIDSILKFIGIEKTYRQGDFIYKEDERIRFNFSAIAKGYGCDAVGKMFERNGVNNYMVEIGGEIALSGNGPSGNDWVIAIDAPVEGSVPGEETAMILSLTDCGIATSGNYRNFRKDNEIEVGHTISPKTGRPFKSSVLSATVIASSCMEADGLATACMALSPEEALNLLNETNVEGILILSDTTLQSARFHKFISSASEHGKRARN